MVSSAGLLPVVQTILRSVPDLPGIRSLTTHVHLHKYKLCRCIKKGVQNQATKLTWPGVTEPQVYDHTVEPSFLVATRSQCYD
jgi:hypothetical protein